MKMALRLQGPGSRWAPRFQDGGAGGGHSVQGPLCNQHGGYFQRLRSGKEIALHYDTRQTDPVYGVSSRSCEHRPGPSPHLEGNPLRLWGFATSLWPLVSCAMPVSELEAVKNPRYEQKLVLSSQAGDRMAELVASQGRRNDPPSQMPCEGSALPCAWGRQGSASEATCSGSLGVVVCLRSFNRIS